MAKIMVSKGMGLRIGKGILTRKCQVTEGTEDQEGMELIMGLLDQDMIVQFHHQLISAGVDTDLDLLLLIKKHVTRCLVIATPFLVFIFICRGACCLFLVHCQMLKINAFTIFPLSPLPHFI